MLTAISVAGLAAVAFGFAAFSLKQMAEWQRLLAAHTDIKVGVLFERPVLGTFANSRITWCYMTTHC
jgi:hypothetical protein